MFQDENFSRKNLISGLKVIWKRPNEIFKNPQFLRGVPAPRDLIQGNLGNCKFIFYKNKK